MTLEENISHNITNVAAFANILPCITIIHKVADGAVVWMCDRGLNGLGLTLKELEQLGSEYYERYFNPQDAEDYVPKVLGLIERNNNDESISFFQQVRIDKNTNWTWHMTSTRILTRDHENQPILLITQSMPIDSMHTISLKAQKILEENNFLRANITKFSMLSKRELEVLKYLTRGESATACGEQLFISSKTVETHRKNIRKKLGTNSFAELSRYARSFDLI